MEFTANIANLSKYAAGIMAEVELPFPTTTEKVQTALRSIGVDGLRYEEIIITEYSISIEGIAPVLGEYTPIDELNYLAMRMECLSPEDRAKFAAAVQCGEYASSAQDLINLSYPCNLACYTLLPEVKSYEDYGHYLVDTKREFSLPKKARFYFDFAEYGETTVINEDGDLTPQGYIFNNQTRVFQEIYNGKDIPHEYRVFQYPLQAKLQQTDQQRSRDSPVRKRP